MEKLYSPEEVAEYLNVQPEAVRIWLRKGKITGSKLGNVWRIRESSIDKFLEEKENVKQKVKSKPKPIKAQEKEELVEISTEPLEDHLSPVTENKEYEEEIVEEKVSEINQENQLSDETCTEIIEEVNHETAAIPVNEEDTNDDNLDKSEEKKKKIQEEDKLRAVFDQFDI